MHSYAVSVLRFYLQNIIRISTSLQIGCNMLRVFVIFVFTLPSIALADEIFIRRNASSDSHRTTFSDGVMDRSVHDGVQSTERLPSIWLADMFYQALSNFTVQRNVGTSACQKQTDMYIRHLKNNSNWAVKSKRTM